MAALSSLYANFTAALLDTGSVNVLPVHSQTSEGTDALLRYLGVERLVIYEAQVSPINHEQFEVNGRTKVFEFDSRATIRARVSASGVAQLSLTLKPIDGQWSFRTAFPNLPDSSGVDNGFVILTESCFYDLPASNPLFTISTFEDSTLGVEEGVVFQVQIHPWDAFPALAKMSATHSAITCRGTIDIGGSLPLFRLEAPLKMLTFPVGNGVIGDVVLALQTAATSADAPARSHAALRGRIAIGSSAPSLTLEASLLEGDFVWQFQGFSSPGVFSLRNGFAELAHLAGIQSADFLLPPELEKLASFQLREIQVGVIPSSKSIQYVSFAVESPEQWNTPIPDLKVSGLGVGWMFLLTPPCHIHGYVFGHLLLDRGDAQFQLEVSARMPDFEIRASLPNEDSVNLRKILETYFGAYPFEHELAVDRLDLSAEPGASTYEMAIEVSDDWPIFGELVLSPLSLAIKSTVGSAACDLTARFKLDDLKFFVHAAYPDSGGGWQFEGGLLPHEPLALGSFVQKLMQHFGKVSAPGILENATVQNVGVSFNTGSKDFHFSIEAKLPVTELAVTGETVGSAPGSPRGT